MISFDLDPRALREPAARRLIGSDLASLVGDLMVLAAMPIAVAAIGGGATAIGVVLAAQGFAVVAGLLMGGLIADRLPRRGIMIAADLVRLGSQAVVAALLIVGEATLWELLVAQAIHGIATGFFLPAAQAIVPDAVEADAVQATNGSKGFVWAIAATIGPVLGATIAAAIGPGWAMAADAATFAISASLLAGVAAVQRTEEPEPIGQQFREGLAAFRSRSWLSAVVAQWTLINALAIAPFFVLGPVFADQHFGGASGWAWMLGALGFGELIGALMSTGWRPDRPLVAALRRGMLWAVPVVLMAFEAPLPAVAAGLSLAGYGLTSFDTIWKTTIQTEVPERQRAQVISLDLIGSLAVVPLGYLLGGSVAATISASAALVAGAILVVGSTAIVLALPSVRGFHRTSTTKPTSGPTELAGTVAATGGQVS